MKHKYVFSKDSATGELLIREYAELNKDTFSAVCDTVYDVKRFEEALARGPVALMAEMRTQNFYPPTSFSEKIVLGISDMMSAGDQEMIEIFCDDADFLTKNLDRHEAFESMDDEEDESLDDFIDEDLPDAFSDDVKSEGVASADLDIEDHGSDDDED